MTIFAEAKGGPGFWWVATMVAAGVLLFGTLFVIDPNIAIVCGLLVLSFALARWRLSRTASLFAAPVLAVLALVIIPQPSILWTRHMLAAYALPDISPTKPVTAAGDIRVITAADPSKCGFYCRWLLLWTDVRSVTLDLPDNSMDFARLTSGRVTLSPAARSYRLSDKRECQGFHGYTHFRLKPEDELAFEACIVAGAPATRFDMLLRQGSFNEPRGRDGRDTRFGKDLRFGPIGDEPRWARPGVDINYTEMRGADGRLLVRRYTAWTDAWAVPFGLGYRRSARGTDRYWIAHEAVGRPDPASRLTDESLLSFLMDRAKAQP